MEIQNQPDYRDILRSKLADRCQKNSSYSLRAFARDLCISPQRLSHVLKGKHGISPEAAIKIADSLGMDGEEKDYFFSSVQKNHARSNHVRKLASEKLQEIQKQYQQLDMDKFKIISDWYHFAIMELTLVEGFSSDAKWIARALSITEIEAIMAIERLLRLGLLEKDERQELKLTGNFFADPKGTPSAALRRFHFQLINKALHSLEFQTIAERNITSLVLAVDEKDIPEAKKDIEKFQAAFDAKYSKSKIKSKVYCLAIQFFNLCTLNKGEK